MKKLLMFAAAMTIVGGAYAQCGDAGSSPSACDVPVWDFKASGKTANLINKGYKSVQKVKFVGALVGNIELTPFVEEVETEVNGTNVVISVTNEVCCLSTFDLYLYVKADKAIYLFEENEIGKMTVFGKSLRSVLKPGKSTKVESDILWTWLGDAGEYGDDPDAEVELTFVGFGKGKRYMSKKTDNTDPCGDNSVPGCEESFDWPSWNGWFAGWYLNDNNDFETLLCEYDCRAVAGGVWSAKYNKKLSNATNVEAALVQKFKALIVDND